MKKQWFRFLSFMEIFLLLMAGAAWKAGAVVTAGPLPAATGLRPRKQNGARGPRDLTDGVIKDVHCRGARLDMDLQTTHETMHLFTRNYFKIDFSALDFTPSGKVNPCREIKGMKARVVFYDIKGRPDEGELISVELRK
jgi:hypothetical protein